MACTDIGKVRIEVADLDPSLPLLSDDEYMYLLEKNNNSIVRASVDAARIILLKLSQQTDETVSIFSVRGSKAAESYRLALELYIKNPQLNPLYNNLQGYFGGVSLSDMSANNANADNNIVVNPGKTDKLYVGSTTTQSTTGSTGGVQGPPGPMGPVGPMGPEGPVGPVGPMGSLLGINTISGTAYTLTAADNGYILYCTSATAITLTTPAGIGAAFSCMVVQAGMGQITVAAGAGTTLASFGSMVKSAGQYATLTLFTPVADTFILAGQVI
ncbi:MAG: hypothetical protein ABFD50_07195 [Smithella sp.]